MQENTIEDPPKPPHVHADLLGKIVEVNTLAAFTENEVNTHIHEANIHVQDEYKRGLLKRSCEAALGARHDIEAITGRAPELDDREAIGDLLNEAQRKLGDLQYHSESIIVRGGFKMPSFCYTEAEVKEAEQARQDAETMFSNYHYRL